MANSYTQEDIQAYREHMENVLNEVYNTKAGREYMQFIMSYCKYWTPASALVKAGFKESEVLTMNNVVKNCVFAYLKPEYIGELIKQTKERQNGRK